MKRLAFVLAAVLLSTACADAMPEARVPKGAQFFAGDQSFDAFFLDIHDAQIASAKLVGERQSARKPLQSSLGLPENADTAQTLAVFDERFAELRSDREFAGTVEQSMKAEQKRRKRLQARLDDLASLQTRSRELLPKIKTTFQSSGRAAIVEVELKEAQKAIDIMGERTAHAIAEADKLTVGIQVQLDTPPLNAPPGNAASKSGASKGAKSLHSTPVSLRR